jgi:hypothetical protein
MKKLSAILFILISSILYSQSSTKNTTLITNCGSCSGSYTWNFSTPMDPDITFGSMSLSKDLQSSNYNFSIPSGATILGIEVLIQYQTTFSTPTMFISDTLVSLMKAGIPVGNSQHTLTSAYTNTNVTPVTFGSTSNLWGTTWTPADINSSGFGFNFKLYSNWPNMQLKLWQGILITVHYSTSTGLISSQTRSLKTDNVLISNNKLKVLNLNENINTKVEVFDITGKQVLSYRPFYDSSLDLENLIKGIYFYRLTHDGKSISAKFYKD